MAASSNMVIQRIPCYLTTAKNLCHHVRIFSETCFVVSPLCNMYGRTSLEKMKCRNSIPCHMHELMQTKEIQFVGYWRVLIVHTEYFNNEESFIWRNSLWLPTCRDDDTFSQKESKWWVKWGLNTFSPRQVAAITPTTFSNAFSAMTTFVLRLKGNLSMYPSV